jgi:phenol/toluene 2-monooxygenase (NADH) P4/A4
MTVKAIYDYDYPSRDRQELFGDDLLVNVQWVNNPMFAAPACFRAPRAISWADFKSQLIDPWAASDHDYNPEATRDWQVAGGEAINPDANPSLGDTGVVHKGLITFRT